MKRRDSCYLGKVAGRQRLVRTRVVHSTSGLSGYEMGLRATVRALLKIATRRMKVSRVAPRIVRRFGGRGSVLLGAEGAGVSC